MAKPVIQYAIGRYERVLCGDAVLVTELTDELPVCPRCGGQNYEGPPPEISIPEPPRPKNFVAGMYQCGACGDRTVLPEATDKLPECGFCGADCLKPM